MTSADPITDQFGLDIQPLGARIGAEIKNIDLSDAQPPEVIGAIRLAVLDHKVVFFRGQNSLADRGQEVFASLLGASATPSATAAASSPNRNLQPDSEQGESWRTDDAFVDSYPRFSVLRAIHIPDLGRETQWANMAAAYNDMPEKLKSLADRLWALHSNAHDDPAANEDAHRHRQEIISPAIQKTEHPLIRIHPDTGERVIFLGHFIRRILGYTTEESTRLFDLLQTHATRADNVVRWLWRPGDVALWDSNATQHRALLGQCTGRTIWHRVTVAGEAPLSIDGRKSRTMRRDMRQQKSAISSERLVTSAEYANGDAVRLAAINA